MSTSEPDDDFSRTAKGAASYAGVGFGGFLLVVVGLFQVIEGIAAISDDEIYASHVQYFFQLNVTVWGWIQLILGIIAVVIAVGLLMGQSWGMVSGIVICGLGAISSFLFIPYYPAWNIVTLGLYVFVTWALFVQMQHRRTA